MGWAARITSSFMFYKRSVVSGKSTGFNYICVALSKHMLLPVTTQLGFPLLRLAGFFGFRFLCFLSSTFSRAEHGFVPFPCCH